MPTSSFSIGSSSNSAQVESKSLVDLSLDDIMKARRAEHGKKKSGNKRASIKTKNTSKKATPTQKSVGRSVAKRGAKIAARRGISDKSNPTSMQIEKEVKRQQQRPSQKRQGLRSSNKTRVNKKVTTDNKNKGKKVAAPSKKAVDAALKAMTKAGYDAPNGMKMVISFAPASNNGISGNQKPKQQKNKNQQRSGRGAGRGRGRGHL